MLNIKEYLRGIYGFRLKEWSLIFVFWFKGESRRVVERVLEFWRLYFRFSLFFAFICKISFFRLLIFGIFRFSKFVFEVRVIF